MESKLQFIENILISNPKYLEENEEARNIVFNTDYTSLKTEVTTGYFNYIYMGFCTHCYQGPCKNYISHPLYETYKKKYERYEEQLRSSIENDEVDNDDDDFYVSDEQELFMCQHTHFNNIKKASREYILKMQKQELGNFLYTDLVNIIAEYL